MEERNDKGVIQRVIDDIFTKFGLNSDIKKNCQIKISFLEIYNERVTDLLEGYEQELKHQNRLAKKLEKALNSSHVLQKLEQSN